MSKRLKAFTLIELLVVIAIIGILVTIAVIALNSARSKARDAKRVANIKQVQTALELFFNDKNRYPTLSEYNSGALYSTSSFNGTTTYMEIVPEAPTPPDGNCTNLQNQFSYTPAPSGGSYTISYCLGNPTGSVSEGPHCATPGGIDVGTVCGNNVGENEPQDLPFFSVTFGDSGYQEGYFAQQTSDGGYIIVGTNEVAIDGGSYVVKTDANGVELWNKKIIDSSFVAISSIKQTSDGGYFMVGNIDSNSGDVYVVKIDAGGNDIWRKIIGDSLPQRGFSGQQTSDGGYIVGGYGSFSLTGDDYLLIKLDASGEVIWDNHFGNNSFETAYSVQQTSDGGYVLSGYTDNNGSDYDIYLVKTNSSGSEIWNKNIGGTGYQLTNSSQAVQQTSDGGYIIVGYNGTNANGDVYLIKIDSLGNIIWEKNIGNNDYQFGRSVQQTSDGGYIIVGENMISGSDFDIYLVKTNNNGDVIWNKIIGDSNDQTARSVQQTSDGGYIIAGGTSVNGNDFLLIKTDANGNLQ